MKKLLFLFFLAFPLSAYGADFELSGQIVNAGGEEEHCHVARAEASFVANNGSDPSGSATFTGRCARQSVALNLPAVDGSVERDEFVGIYAGSGKFGGQDFPIKMTIMGKIKGKKVDGEAIFSFNDMVYNAGKFRGNIK